MPIVAIAALVIVALVVRRCLPHSASARLGRGLFWLCNLAAAALVVVLGAVILRGAGQAGIGLVFLPLYLGAGAALVGLGLVLQRILARGIPG